MKICLRVLAAVAAGFSCQAALAESMQCSGGGVSEGDSRVAVAFKCGRPLLEDSYCSPVYYRQTPTPVPEVFVGTLAPCLQIDEWLYDRGPGNLMATVRFRAGTVQSISYGRSPK